MKKIILLLILNLSFLIFNSQKAKAQWVTIPDANFVTWLTAHFPTCMNGNQMDTTCNGIVNATTVDVNSSNISNLSGIQYFDNLLTLLCHHNQLTSLNLSANNALISLECNNNQLNSLNLSNNSALIFLECSYNYLTNLNLSTCTALSTLWCFNNGLTSLNLSTNAALTTLISANNPLTSLNLSANTALVSLWCDYNQLTSLNLSANTALVSLRCDYNQLTSLNLSTNTALINVRCKSNLLTNLNLPTNTVLTSLDCSNNQLTVLAQMPNVMSNFKINNNNINCLLNLPQVSNSSANANLSNNPLTCVPNQTSYSLGLPLCESNDVVNNPNNCQSVANIVGNVFTDLDSNCTYSNTDWNTGNIPVKLYDNQNNFLAMSYTITGVYSFAALQPDSFKVKIDDMVLPLDMACGQANNQNVTLDSTNQTIANINFPVVCDSTFDVEVHSVTRQGWVFPGQVHTLNSNLANWYNFNCGNSIYSGTVTINVAGSVTYISPTPNALTPMVSGNTFTYNIMGFDSITPTSFGLQLLTDTTAQAGQQICIHVSIATTPTDADTSNNEYDFCYNVVNSYDPNMKEVYPTDVLPGYNDWFTYTIHFQNTGNAPAFNIRLRDTLDTQLDLNTFEFLGASHTATTSLNGRNLSVRFNNIMLPDSTSNYDGSMGYYQYRIKPLQNLPNGSNIKNTAYIYFDYNPAIITNTTENHFDITTALAPTLKEGWGGLLYPNPNNGILNVECSNLNSNSRIEITNLLGEVVLSEKLLNHHSKLNIQNLPKGVYVAKVNGAFVRKLVKE